MAFKQKSEESFLHVTVLLIFNVGENNEFTLQKQLPLSNNELHGSRCFGVNNNCYVVSKHQKTTENEDDFFDVNIDEAQQDNSPIDFKIKKKLLEGKEIIEKKIDQFKAIMDKKVVKMMTNCYTITFFTFDQVKGKYSLKEYHLSNDTLITNQKPLSVFVQSEGKKYFLIDIQLSICPDETAT